VLSALYFSQARDVKRLREWAGRAPERATEQAMGGRVVAQPQQAAQPAAQAPGAQAVKPVPAVASAAGAQTATAAGPAEEDATPAAADGEKAEEPGAADSDGDAAKPAVATPAAAAAKPAAATPAGAAAAGQVTKPGALTPAAVASAAAGAAKGPATAGARPGGSATGTVTRPGPPAIGGGRPTTPAAASPRRSIPSLPSSQTSVMASRTPPRDRWYHRLADRLPAGRYIALIVAGALVLGGGAAFGITQLSGSDSGGGAKSSVKKSTPPASSPGKPSKKGSGKSAPAIDPAKVTVTVVNGTTIPNLARDTASKLRQVGFQIGNKVTGTGSLAAAESVVEYRPGAEAEARFVAAKLRITQKQPADPDALAQAGPAQVIVVLGADQAPGG
jgi:hypothetical protein